MLFIDYSSDNSTDFPANCTNSHNRSFCFAVDHIKRGQIKIAVVLEAAA